MFASFGRSFFSLPVPDDNSTWFNLDAGRQVWSGYFFGTKLGPNMTPIVNIDGKVYFLTFKKLFMNAVFILVANSVFIKKQSTLEFMCDVLNQVMNSRNYSVANLESLREPYYLKSQEHQAFVKGIKGNPIFRCYG
jgi:hypothetical protein